MNLILMIIFLFTFVKRTILLIENEFEPTTDVKFHLYTRKNPNRDQIIEYGNLQNFTNSNFQVGKDVKINIHGKSVNWSEPWLVNAFLQTGDSNVVLVDWSKGVYGEEFDMIKRVPGIARFIAKFIDWITQLGVSYDDVHIIGSSLGSHISGWVGRSSQKKVAYITVCDPPISFWEKSAHKVNIQDAKYVEVIHTNTGKIGLIYPIGTADFYPNGGVQMPGCGDDHMCSHIRGKLYFYDSINHRGFTAIKCNNYNEIVHGNCSNIAQSYMGGSSPKNISGVFYLETNAQEPFYKGQAISL